MSEKSRAEKAKAEETGPDESGPDAVVDPDVDLRDPTQRTELLTGEWPVLAAIAVGGVLGAEARYGLGEAWPHGSGTFAWATVLINVFGSLLIGVLMACLAAARAPHRLVRPFLGVGMLGGFTTFSTFAVDTYHLLQAGRAGLALTYVAVSVVACVVAAAAGEALTSRLVQR